MTRRIAAVTLVAIAALFAVVALYAHPIADDFDFASGRRDAGFVSAWRQQYVGWNGRFSSNALALAIPLNGGSTAGYRAAIVAILIATLLALYALMRSLDPGEFTPGQTALAALALFVLFLSGMPALGEGIYWYTSAVTYQAAVVVAALHVALVASARRHHSLSRFTLAGILLFLVCGFNEVIAAFAVAAYGLATVGVWPAGARDRRVFGAMLAIAAVGALAIVGSPGNAARLAAYPLRHRLFASLGMTTLQTARFLAEWSTSGPLLVTSAIWIASADRVAASIPRFRARRYLAACTAGILLVVPLAAFPAYWATGILGQHRTIDTAYFAFLLLWFAAVTLWCAAKPEAAAVVAAAVKRARTPLVALLLAALALTHNSYAAGSDLASGRLAAYDRAMQARDVALDACCARRERTCVLAPIGDPPASLLVIDIARSPSDWVNLAYARYFNVPRVTAAPAGQDDHVRH